MDWITPNSIHLRWPTPKGPRLMVMSVLSLLVLLVMLNGKSKMFTREEERVKKLELLYYKSYVPESPNETRGGEPADIPRHFIIEEGNACQSEGLEIVAYVHSAIKNVEDRLETRMTWANKTSNLRMVVMFMVGRAKDDTEKEIVKRESDLYHDIVQGDYNDHYKLLTYKALSSLYWIIRNCGHVPWTLHTDDDILIDTYLFNQFLAELHNSSHESQIHCQARSNMVVHRKGKWAVSEVELPDGHYPTFCRGSFWFVRTSQVPRLLDAASEVNFIWPDDAYLTGYVAGKANISLYNIGNRITKMFHPRMLGKKLAYIQLRNRGRLEKWERILSHYKELPNLRR